MNRQPWQAAPWRWDLGVLCSNDPVCARHSPDRDASEHALLDQAAERALGAGGAGRQQDRGHRYERVVGGGAVNPLADGARRVAALERDRCD